MNLGFALSKANAIAGTKIDITTQGVGTSYLHPYVEEDSGTREALTLGGASGADLGSFQYDAFQGHYHKIYDNDPHYPLDSAAAATGSTNIVKRIGTWGADRYNAKEIYNDPAYGSARVAVETRTRNVYVNYIIKR